MTNPWLTIPLSDYEGHMSMPDVGQAKMLAAELEALLRAHNSRSVALIGCAGGNGFEQAVRAGVDRVVGVDINPHYIADARARFAASIPGLELYCADIERAAPEVGPVELIYAALVFEYVDVAKALQTLRGLCAPGGALAVLLQLPQAGAGQISSSPYATLQALGSIMRLVRPEEVRVLAKAAGFDWLAEKAITLPSGNSFCLLTFKTETLD